MPVLLQKGVGAGPSVDRHVQRVRRACGRDLLAPLEGPDQDVRFPLPGHGPHRGEVVLSEHGRDHDMAEPVRDQLAGHREPAHPAVPVAERVDVGDQEMGEEGACERVTHRAHVFEALAEGPVNLLRSDKDGVPGLVRRHLEPTRPHFRPLSHQVPVIDLKVQDELVRAHL